MLVVFFGLYQTAPILQYNLCCDFEVKQIEIVHNSVILLFSLSSHSNNVQPKSGPVVQLTGLSSHGISSSLLQQLCSDSLML